MTIERWLALLRDFYQRFKYQNIMTEDMVAYFNQKTGMNLTPIFNQYLRHTAIPDAGIEVRDSGGNGVYRWKADEPEFAMPVRVGEKRSGRSIQPTTSGRRCRRRWHKDTFDVAFDVATDLYYVNVSKE